MNLRFWIQQQEMTVRELAHQIGVPLPTVEDWVYRGAKPSQQNADRLNDFIVTSCKHHWVIESANGPLSEGVCQRCGEHREFMNSGEPTSPWGKRQKAA